MEHGWFGSDGLSRLLRNADRVSGVLADRGVFRVDSRIHQSGAWPNGATGPPIAHDRVPHDHHGEPGNEHQRAGRLVSRQIPGLAGLASVKSEDHSEIGQLV